MPCSRAADSVAIVLWMLRQRVIRNAVARQTTLLIRGRDIAAERETNGLRARDVDRRLFGISYQLIAVVLFSGVTAPSLNIRFVALE